MPEWTCSHGSSYAGTREFVRGARRAHDCDVEKLGRLRYALIRLNVDWQTVRQCGDPKCGGDCRWVAEIENLLHMELS